MWYPCDSPQPDNVWAAQVQAHCMLPPLSRHPLSRTPDLYVSFRPPLLRGSPLAPALTLKLLLLRPAVTLKLNQRSWDRDPPPTPQALFLNKHGDDSYFGRCTLQSCLALHTSASLLKAS